MKARIVGKALDWLTVRPVTAAPLEDDRQFGFDPDFVVFEKAGDELVERDVLFEPHPGLSAGSAPRPGN